MYLPDYIDEAQSLETYTIDGVKHTRVRYGDESDDWGADSHPCYECKVKKGQFHVPGCDIEYCPCCGGQVITCDCNYERDDDEE